MVSPLRFASHKASDSQDSNPKGSPMYKAKKRTMAEYAFIASLAISVAATCVALGGLASMQAFCDANGNLFKGITKEALPKAHLKYDGVPCAKIFRYEWWGWSLQCFFLVVTCVCWATTNVHNYKSALWSMAAVVITMAIVYANDLLDMYDKTKGDLHVRGIITFLGYCGFCAGNFLITFTGNALYHVKRSEYLEMKAARYSEEKKLAGVASNV